MRSLLLFFVFAVELVAAQSLPPCAQSCVAKTRTKCKSTDYTCACLDKKYITKLTKCIGRACNDAESHDAAWYLTSLCYSVGVPLQRVAAAGNSSTASEQIQLELRDNFVVQERQASFTRTIINATISSPATRFTSRATATTTTTGFTLPTSNSDNGNGGGSGGLSTSAKVGLGLGLPIGLFSVVGAIVLVLWFLRKRKEEKAAAMAQNPQNHSGGQPQMMLPGHPQQPIQMAPMQQEAKLYVPPQGGPAELSQNAQYIGHELHTQGGNTIEMPANQTPGPYPPSKGPSPGPLGYSNPPQGYAQPQPINPQQQYYPPPQQPANSSPAPPTAQGHSPAPVQHQGPTAAELPERKKTPNMYE